MSNTIPAEPVRVLISYRHTNHSVRDEVRKHLGWLENSDRIRVFDDRDILAGDQWDARIKAELDQAQIIILIVTADFMNSSYCTKVELKSALECRAREGTRVIPIIAEACDWEAMPIFHIAALPKDRANNLKPLNRWRYKDEALTQIAQQVRRNVERLTTIANRQPSSSLAIHNDLPSNPSLILERSELEDHRIQTSPVKTKHVEMRNLQSMGTTDTEISQVTTNGNYMALKRVIPAIVFLAIVLSILGDDYSRNSPELISDMPMIIVFPTLAYFGPEIWKFIRQLFVYTIKFIRSFSQS